MAAGVPTRLSAAHGRRFGLTVGSAFLVLAAVAWWRAYPLIATALCLLGSTLFVAGLTFPVYLGPMERAWMKLAHGISRVTNPVVMGAIYILVLTPVGLLRRAFGGNPMVHQEELGSYWKPRPESRRASDLRRQF